MTRTELIAALKSAKGPDRELDKAVWRQFHAPGMEPGSTIHFPKYTASIDAAVALIERVRPETLWAVYSGGEAEVDDETGTATVGARAATPAIALCIALLESMEDK